MAIITRKQNDWNHEVRIGRQVIGWVVCKPFLANAWQFIAASASLSRVYPDSEQDYPTWQQAVPTHAAA